MAWKIQEAHKWVEIPHTTYERRRELRIRECRQTAISWDKRYFDIDTMKFNSDKMCTIYSNSLADICIDDIYVESQDLLYKRRYRKEEAWFTPKDNDFDEECRRDEENKKYHEEMIRKQEIESAKLKEQYYREQKILEEKEKLEKEYKIQQEIEYQKQIKETELRSTGRHISGGIDSIKNLPRMSYIIPNCWKPK